MARRVNTKFLTIFTSVVVGLGVAALIVNKFFITESPEKYVAAGQAAMAEAAAPQMSQEEKNRRYTDAVNALGRAVSLDNKNPSMWVAYGDALNQLSPTDVEFMTRARRAWDQALLVDPQNKPALDRMMSFWSEVANLDPSRPETFEELNKKATALFAADPKNAAAEVAMTTSRIRPWLAGVEKDREQIKQIVTQLEKLMEKYPENPDLPMFTAQAKLKLAEGERQRERGADADKLVAEAVKTIDDAVKRAPSPAMYFSAAQVAQAQEMLYAFDRSPTGQERMLEVRKKKQGYYAKARETCTVEDPLYVQIHLSAARAAADKPEAEKILRELLAKREDDQQVRLALAEQLAGNAEKRDEAIEILDRPFAPSRFTGPKAYMVRELQVRTLVVGTNLRLDKFAGASKPDRDQLLPRIQDALAKIEAKEVDSARPLRLRGKLLRLQGENFKAIQVLERARAIAEKNSGQEFQSDRIDRWEVIDLLAKAYIDTQQTGRAKSLLNELVNRFPQYHPARMLLSQLLVREGAMEEARPHIQHLQQLRPNDADVIKLALQASGGRAAPKDAKDAEQQKAVAKANFARLPEETKPQLLDKIAAAMVIDQPDDAVRVLDKALATFPGDYDLARMGVRVYRQLGEPDKARQVVELAAAANAGDDRFRVLREQVKDMTPDALLQVALKESETNPDPVAKAVTRAGIFRRMNRNDEALKELLEAQRLKPGDTDITAILFNQYLVLQQYDKAEALLEALTAANQDESGGLLFRYRLAMSRGNYQSAMDYARTLTQRMGEFGQSWLALAQALQATGQNEEALSKYLTALEKQSDNPDVFAGIINCYYAMNRPANAKQYIAQARKVAPSNPHFAEMEIQHEMNFGDPEKAVAPREELVKKDPSKAGNVMSLGQAYLATARSYAAKPDKQTQAAPMFARAKQTFRDGLAKWPDEIAFYAYYAEACARSGELGDSEAQLKQLAQRDAWKGKTEPQLLLAEYYGVARRPADAQATYNAILAKDPKNAEVQIRLANLLLSQNKTDEALAALSSNGDDPRVARRRVDVMLATGKEDEAAAAIAKALEKSPGNLELIHLAAGVDLNRGKFAEAEQRLKRALEIEPKNPTTHFFVGKLKTAQPKPDLDAAIREFQLAKDSPTQGIEARFALAECMRRKGNADAGIRELEEALAQQPGNYRVRIGLLDAYASLQPPRWVDSERVIGDAEKMPGYTPKADLLQRKANMWSARNEPKKAMDAIRDAAALNPDNKEIARNYLNLLVKAKQYQQVSQEVDKLVAKDPSAWWAYQARAVANRYLGRKDDSIKDFDAALAAANSARDDSASDEVVRVMGDVIGPDEVIGRIQARAEREDRWKIMIAMLQQTKGDNESAIRTVEQVLARDEQLAQADRERALRFGGMLYLMTKQPNKAANCYEKLLKLSPDDMVSLNNMACLLAESVQPPRPQDGLPYAKHAYDLMMRSGRKDVAVYDTYGWLLTLCNRVDEGIEILRTANDMKAIPDAHYHLAEAYLRKGFADQAVQELEMAMDLVKRYEQDKTPLDETLRGKIEAAMGRASLMQQQKKSTAVNAPTGTNVP
ncbi:MAG TPA: tetratricopeptide repeat protein [Tepidisphaeraceae bacterium]|nr:tetratricopeptide repeat protein [Tepidisphaeraceae bacterium]